jgi:alpha-galactosidase
MKINILFISVILMLIISCQKESVFWLDDIDLVGMTSGLGIPQPNQSVILGPLTISGQVYEKGIGTNAVSTLLRELNGNSLFISGWVGIDDSATDKASVNFLLIGDSKILWQSGTMNLGDSAVAFKVRINKIKKLGLSGKFSVRDVWRQRDLGEFTGEFETSIPYHGVKLIRIY